MGTLLFCGLSALISMTFVLQGALTLETKTAYFLNENGLRNSVNIYKTFQGTVKSKIACSLKCTGDPNCVSYNYDKDSNTCELSNSLDVPERLDTQNGILNNDSVWSIGYVKLEDGFCGKVSTSRL